MPTIQFKGKQLVQSYHLVVPYHELKPIKSKSVTNKISLHDSLVIHGDNLRALKGLLPYYSGKVKCIYIDPPYNTGNVKKEGWRYPDDLNSPMMQEWLGKVVSREDLTRHDKWLCMIWPRLRLLREFLSDDGVILVSIDDNESHHLRLAVDEIFGEENFVAQLVWEKGRKNDARLFSVGHEYILVYARSLARLRELKTIWRETRPGAKELWEKYLSLRRRHGNKDRAIEEELHKWFSSLPEDNPAKALGRFKRVDKWGPWRDRDISWPGG
jgi:adenine-specific DNA-methyltransferase